MQGEFESDRYEIVIWSHVKGYLVRVLSPNELTEGNPHVQLEMHMTRDELQGIADQIKDALAHKEA